MHEQIRWRALSQCNQSQTRIVHPLKRLYFRRAQRTMKWSKVRRARRSADSWKFVIVKPAQVPAESTRQYPPPPPSTHALTHGSVAYRWGETDKEFAIAIHCPPWPKRIAQEVELLDRRPGVKVVKPEKSEEKSQKHSPVFKAKVAYYEQETGWRATSQCNQSQTRFRTSLEAFVFPPRPAHDEVVQGAKGAAKRSAPEPNTSKPAPEHTVYPYLRGIAGNARNSETSRQVPAESTRQYPPEKDRCDDVAAIDACDDTKR